MVIQAYFHCRSKTHRLFAFYSVYNLIYIKFKDIWVIRLH